MEGVAWVAGGDWKVAGGCVWTGAGIDCGPVDNDGALGEGTGAIGGGTTMVEGIGQAEPLPAGQDVAPPTGPAGIIGWQGTTDWT